MDDPTPRVSDLSAGDAASIDHQVGDRAKLAKTVLAISRESRVIRDQGITSTGKTIK